jgi:hypothetical protein
LHSIIALWRKNDEVNSSLAKKWRSQSLFGEEMAKSIAFWQKNAKMAKSIALWRKNGEVELVGEEMAKSIARWRNKWRSQSLFGETNGEVNRFSAKNVKPPSRLGEPSSRFGEIESRFGEEI